MKVVKITPENRNEALKLQVKQEQINYIESVEECLQEADALASWNPVGLYVQDTMVGFAMYGYIQEAKYARLWFDRLLIDGKYQGHHYGSQAFEMVFHQIQKEYPGKDIYLSVYDDNVQAIALYKKHGFDYTGELDTKGEKIMKYMK